MRELDLTAAFLAAIPFRFGSRMRGFRRNIVNAMVEKGGRHYAARAGIVGQADVYVIVDGGLIVECELKAAAGRKRAAQIVWQEWCQEHRVPHLVLRARINEEPAATVDRWCDELDQKIKEWKP